MLTAPRRRFAFRLLAAVLFCVWAACLWVVILVVYGLSSIGATEPDLTRCLRGIGIAVFVGATSLWAGIRAFRAGYP
jgi:hypothetical protein